MSPTQNTVKSLAERRARKQKIFIAVGSVVLLGVLGFQLPKIMGHKGGQSAAPAVSTALPGVGAAPVVPAGQLPGDRVIVRRDSNQLISFGLFKSKDPFVQQLTTTATPTPVPAPAPTPAPPTGSAPPTATVPTPTPVVPGGSPSSTTPSAVPPGTTSPSATPAAPAVPTEALVATNGVCERVAVSGTFPATENIFRLVSIAKDGKSVQVGIVGGSFDSGQPTATLKLGDKLTLVNTADGTRYVIELESKCAGIPAQQSGTQTTSTSPQPAPTTPVAPTPTPTPTPTTTATTTTTDTVTTPIVTDSLDTTTPSS
jgi:hypothetical protein